ncbi:MAG: N-acetylmuramoyl-L-alanine amidase-like domain-containing protein, partial [Burkholderiales bacterium]
SPIGEIMQKVALQLVGKPYVGGLLDKPTMPEYLYISLEQTDCMLFVEHILAVSELIKSNKLNLNNLASRIKEERYHGNLSYCNRNHYFKDWALDNQKKLWVSDEGMRLSRLALPYSAHVLSDSITNSKNNLHAADLACIKKREQIINQEQLGFIPVKELPKYLLQIKPGDIIGIVRTSNGRADSIYHLGIAYVHNGKVGMIHASSDAKQVVIADSLLAYLGEFKDSQGIILLRAQ